MAIGPNPEAMEAGGEGDQHRELESRSPDSPPALLPLPLPACAQACARGCAAGSGARTWEPGCVCMSPCPLLHVLSRPGDAAA